MKVLNTITKALTAGVVAGYAVYQIAAGGDSPGGEAVTTQEWVNVAVTALVSAVAVWAVPNAEKPSA